MTETEEFEIEHGDLTLLRVHAPPTGLSLTDPSAMAHLSRILDIVARRKPKVLLVLYDEDLFSPARVKETWREIKASGTSKSRVPPQILAARTNLSKLIKYFRTGQTLLISTVRGSVDFDLLGLLAMGHYRVCSNDTVFKNNVVNRETPPGSAVVWLLTRLIGVAATWEILLEGTSLNAQEARTLKLVNKVLPTGDFEADAIAVAEGFASQPRQALSSLVRAFNHVNLPLSDYLEEVGTGFEQIYDEE